MQEELLVFSNITKIFPGVVANDQINLSIRKGEIHSLLGENGAGKSTLMNILYGIYQPDEGDLYYKGEKIRIHTPDQAMALGMGMIHQSFMLVEEFTVFENLILGIKSKKFPWVEKERLMEELKAFVASMEIPVKLTDKIADLSVGMQQKVEILKALYRKADLLILDEPTAVLTPQESKDLFRLLRQLNQDGCTIIFISHKLKEVIEISDRISVLRDGKLIQTMDNQNVSVDELSYAMVGRDVASQIQVGKKQPGEIALLLENVCLSDASGHQKVKNISLQVRCGEILGVAGVDGNGQAELAELISGLTLPDQGQIRLFGQDVTHMKTRERADLGLGYIPADRRTEGLVTDFTIKENLMIRHYYREPFSKGVWLQGKALTKNALTLREKYNIKTPSVDLSTALLSGGNQQKIVLAREGEAHPSMLLIAQPTWGLDVGACQFVYEKILEERDKGVAVLLISTDLEEVRALSDRMAVIYEGQIMGIFERGESDIREVGMMMAGIQKNMKQSGRKA